MSRQTSLFHVLLLNVALAGPIILGPPVRAAASIVAKDAKETSPNTGKIFNCYAKDNDDDLTKAAQIPDSRRLSEVIGLHECWQADVDNENFYHLNDLYGRWVVELVDDHGYVRDYRRERHSPISRFFMGRSRGVVMSVRIRMRDPDIEFNLPLVAVDYNGRGRQGEAFVTTLAASDMAMPDFRLSSNSSVTIEATARIADEVDVQPTGVVLSTLRDTLAVAAPGGSLLTALNRDQVQRVSSAYDVALSRLLSTSVTETISAGRLMSEWYRGASIAVVVYLPEKVRTVLWTANNEPDSELASRPRRMIFRVSMTCPRLSVFDVMNACQKGFVDRDVQENNKLAAADNLQALIYRTDYKIPGRPGFASIQYQQAATRMAERVSPNQVLNFRLGVGKTLRQYLTDQDWFINLSKTMIVVNDDAAPGKGKPNPKLASADQFCAAVSERLYAAGLSRLDAQIGLWAVATGMPDFAAARTVFQQAAVCRNALPGRGWSYLPSERPGSARQVRVNQEQGMTTTESSSNEGA